MHHNNLRLQNAVFQDFVDNHGTTFKLFADRFKSGFKKRRARLRTRQNLDEATKQDAQKKHTKKCLTSRCMTTVESEEPDHNLSEKEP